MNTGLWEMVRLGGPVMWILLGASVLAVGVFFERAVFFHRATVHVDYFLKGIANLLRQGRHEEALERCDEAYGPAVRVIQAGILKRDLPKLELKEVVQEVAQLQVPRLERNLPVLATLGFIAPLLGLLGTVLGMIKAFIEVDRAAGNAPVTQLASGIWEALITTAAGLVVAIVCYVFHNFLVSRLNRIVTDMERAGIEVVQILTGTGVDPKAGDLRVARSAKEAPAGDAGPKEKKEGGEDTGPGKAENRSGS